MRLVWKPVLENVLGTAAAGAGLATILAGLDWISILGIIFSCAANLIGLLQKSPLTPKTVKLEVPRD